MSQRRQLIESLQGDYRITLRRACSLVCLSTSCWYYQSNRKRDDSYLRYRIRDISQVRIRYGFWRIFTLIRREGFVDNHKRVYRIYKEENLNLRSKRHRRHRSTPHRLHDLNLEQLVSKSWCMDFVHDQLFDGRRFRMLTILENCTRRCLAIEVGQSMKGSDVVDTLERIRMCNNKIPEYIQVDNGSEFISKNLDKWAYENHVQLLFSRPGKPTDNAFIESFNGSLRDECLNVNWFFSLQDAKEKIESWRVEYNSYRPHMALDGHTPNEVIGRHNSLIINT